MEDYLELELNFDYNPEVEIIEVHDKKHAKSIIKACIQSQPELYRVLIPPTD